MRFRDRSHLRYDRLNRLEGLARCPGDQQGRAAAHDFGRNRRDLRRRLAKPEHNLRETLPDGAVVVNLWQNRGPRTSPQGVNKLTLGRVGVSTSPEATLLEETFRL